MKERLGTPDVILFTGDLTFRGAPDEFELVDQTLDEIGVALGARPLVIPVPGNHDLSRCDAERARALAARVDNDGSLVGVLGNAGEMDLIRTCFSGYSAWLERRILPDWTTRGLEYRRGKMPGDFTLTVPLGGDRLGFAGLNSASIQLGEGDYQRHLAVSPEQLDVDLPSWTKRHERVFLLMHHPRDWLVDLAIDTMNRDIYPADRFTACFMGHLHGSRPCEERMPRGVRRWIQESSLCGLERYGTRAETRSFGYSWLVLEDDRLERWPREIIAGRDGWRVDVNRDDAPLDKHTYELGTGRTGREPLVPRLPHAWSSFVGRTDELTRLTAAARDRPMTIVGLRGAGKSALARAFADRSPTPESVWWLDAAGEPDEALARLAPVLRALGPASCRLQLERAPSDATAAQLAAVIRSTLGLGTPQLLVLDDLDQPGWSTRLPTGQVQIVATTHDQALAVGDSLRLDALTPTDARALSDTVGGGRPITTEERTARDEVFARLEYHALAVRVASLEVSRWSTTWRDYQASLAARDAQLLSAVPEGYPRALWASLDLSIGRAQQDAASRDVLLVLGQAATAPLPEARLRGAARRLGYGQLAIARALSRLAHLGLVETRDQLRMHGLVRERVRALGADAGDAKRALCTELVEHFDARLGETQTAGAEQVRRIQDELHALAPHLEAVRDAHSSDGSAVYVLGALARRRGEFARARDWLEQALAQVQTPEQHLEVLLELETVSYALDDPRGGEYLAQAAELAAGSTSRKLEVVLRGREGVLLRSRGLLEEAAVKLELAVRLARQLDHAGYLVTALQNQGNLLNEIHRADAARPLLEEAAGLARSVLGPDHTTTAQVEMSLGRSLSMLHDLEAAERLCRHALDVFERASGPDHPDLVFPLMFLADILHVRGHFEDAREVLRRAAALALAFGQGGRIEASALGNLATLSGELGDVQVEAALHEQVLQSFERNPQTTPQQRAQAQLAAGRSRMRTGQDGARELLEAASAGALAAGDARIATAAELAIAQFAARAADWPRAEAALTNARARAPQGDTDLAATIAAIDAEMWFARGEWARARASFEAAGRGMSPPGTASVDLMRVRMNEASAARMMGHSGAAHALYHHALSGGSDLPRTHPERRLLLSMLTRLEAELGHERSLSHLLADAKTHFAQPVDDPAVHWAAFEAHLEALASWWGPVAGPVRDVFAEAIEAEHAGLAAPSLASVLQSAERADDELNGAHAALRWATAQLRAGDWSSALDTARRGLVLSRRAGAHRTTRHLHAVTALAATQAGLVDVAAEHRAAEQAALRAMQEEEM
jgi:tetratricopeptide (TPR) repeat protein